jgi:hypothetical protein
VIAIVTGIAMVALVFLYYVAAPWNFIGRADPIGGEAGYWPVAARAQAELQKTGATWIATTDYRTYAMLRWYFNGRVPVIQINERGRFQDFADPGMDRIKGRTGLYVGREPDNLLPLLDSTGAKRELIGRVDRVWRGTMMDTYRLEKLKGWTVSAGRGSATNGSGRVTSIAARPRRAVKSPFTTPSPSRCDSFAASPCPSICCTRPSLAAIPPVIATWAMTWRNRRTMPSAPGRPP